MASVLGAFASRYVLACPPPHPISLFSSHHPEVFYPSLETARSVFKRKVGVIRHTVNSFNPLLSLRGGRRYYPHVPDEETEGPRGQEAEVALFFRALFFPPALTASPNWIKCMRVSGRRFWSGHCPAGVGGARGGRAQARGNRNTIRSARGPGMVEAPGLFPATALPASPCSENQTLNLGKAMLFPDGAAWTVEPGMWGPALLRPQGCGTWTRGSNYGAEGHPLLCHSTLPASLPPAWRYSSPTHSETGCYIIIIYTAAWQCVHL